MSEIKNLLLDLLKFDTQNSDEKDEENTFKGETLESLNFIKKRFEKKEISVNLVEYSLGNFNKRGFIVAYKNLDSSKKNILLQGHMDTVPFGKFNGNPLGEIKDNIIKGRGSCDMKGPLAALIKSFEEILEKKNAKYNPVLLITSDEEARNFAGIKKFILQNNLDFDLGICAEPSNFVIFNRFKGATSRTIKILGKSAHGARPHEGKNAIFDARKILSLLEDYGDFLKINKENSFESQDEFSSYSTLNVGKITGGIKVNSVPEVCDIEFEMRLVKPLDFYERTIQEQVFSKIENIDYQVEEHFSFEPLIINQEKNPLIVDIKEKIQEIKGVKSDGVMVGFSEATILNLNDIPTIVFGPGDFYYAHNSNEQINLEDLEDYKKILVKLFCDN